MLIQLVEGSRRSSSSETYFSSWSLYFSLCQEFLDDGDYLGATLPVRCKNQLFSFANLLSKVAQKHTLLRCSHVSGTILETFKSREPLTHLSAS